MQRFCSVRGPALLLDYLLLIILNYKYSVYINVLYQLRQRLLYADDTCFFRDVMLAFGTSRVVFVLQLFVIHPSVRDIPSRHACVAYDHFDGNTYCISLGFIHMVVRSVV